MKCKFLLSKVFLVSAFLCTSTVFVSCEPDKQEEKKEEKTDEDKTKEEHPEHPSTGEDNAVANHPNYYKLIRVEDFLGDKDQHKNTFPWIYNLLENKSVNPNSQKGSQDTKNIKTDKWDLIFDSTYHSRFSANNGSDKLNDGYNKENPEANKAIGGIKIIEADFDNVIDVPSDDDFITHKDAIGIDKSSSVVEVTGKGIGWAVYDFDGTLMSDGKKPLKMHIAYSLYKPLKLTGIKGNNRIIPARTIILRTAKGDIAKIRVISAYKGNPDIKDIIISSEQGYTFEYVIVPKGSKKFEIKK